MGQSSKNHGWLPIAMFDAVGKPKMHGDLHRNDIDSHIHSDICPGIM